MSYLKKSFLIVAISVLCFGLDANAQLPQFGAKVGLNLADVYGFEMPSDFQYTKEVREGLVVGAYMTYDIMPLFSIQPEVLYSMKGTKFNVTSPVPADYLFSYNYIEVPVLLKLNLPIGTVAPFKVNVFAGPDFAFNVTAYEKVTDSVLPNNSTTFDEKFETSSFDFNLAVGAGTGLDVGPTTLGLELRYTFGTHTLTKGSGSGDRNGVFAVIASVGI